MEAIKMVDLKRQYERFKDEIDVAIQEVLDSTAFIDGPSVKAFREEFAGYLDVPHIIPCANGTDALQVALMSLDLQPGDEVITTPFSFIACIEVIKLLKLVPVLADVDPRTFNIDPEQIERMVNKSTKAIIPVHLYGQMADMAAVMNLSREFNLKVIEDCAQAHGAMFEAIHGSAPRRAGQNLANPSGLLLGGVMMMVHVGQPDVAERVHNAWLKTIEDGIHTYDIYRDGVSTEKVGTKEFADAVIARLGENPSTLGAVSYSGGAGIPQASGVAKRAAAKRELVGVDVFLDWIEDDRSPEMLGEKLSKTGNGEITLTMITNRGLKVWPKGAPETFCTDHWRCRFTSTTDGAVVTQQQIIDLLQRVHDHGFDIIKTEQLFTFDGEPGFSLGQGQ